jgi:hypothetical protein
MEAILSSETSVYTRSTRRHIPEDGILQVYLGTRDRCLLEDYVDDEDNDGI